MRRSGQIPVRATESDLPAIQRVIELAYAKYLDRMDRPPEPVGHDYLGDITARRIWVVGEPITGVIVLVRQADSMLVENVAVDPAAQGTGLGRLLMEFAAQQAKAAGLSRLTLYTNAVMTENLAIYTRLGYRETARRAEHGYRRVFMGKHIGASERPAR